MCNHVCCRAYSRMLGDKEIAVRIRGNSHYRISFFRSSRNAYRSVTHKSFLGSMGRLWQFGMAGYRYFCAQVPHRGYFYFILLNYERILKK